MAVWYKLKLQRCVELGRYDTLHLKLKIQSQSQKRTVVGLWAGITIERLMLIEG